MNLDRPSLDAAVSRSILSSEQADRLWKFLGETGRDAPGFRFAHVLYYLGGVVAIGAMTLFMTKGWERFGGTGIFVIAVVYCVIALTLTTHLIRRGHPIPAGLTGAFAVALVPLAYKVFRDSMLFPLALSAIGLGVVGLGILWQKREEAIAQRAA